MSAPTDPTTELTDRLDQIAEWATQLENGSECMRAWQIERLARYMRDAAQRGQALLQEIKRAGQ